MIEFKQVVGCDKKFNFLSKNISISCCSLEMDIRRVILSFTEAVQCQ